MERIRDAEQFKERVRENKLRLGKTAGNSILLPAVAERFAKEDRLFCEVCEHGTAFFVDEGGYYNLYYFWEPLAPLADFRREKPVLIEELDNNGSRAVYLERFEPILEAAGFRRFKVNLQVQLDLRKNETALRERFSEDRARLTEQGLCLRFDGDGSLMTQALKLWEGHLDQTDVPADHRILGPDDRLLCIVDRSGVVAAVNWWRNTPSSSEGRHTVTAPAYYRRGLASAMLHAWCLDALERGANRAFTWISDRNVRSLALYKKAGFSENGRVSRQYILNGEESSWNRS